MQQKRQQPQWKQPQRYQHKWQQSQWKRDQSIAYRNCYSKFQHRSRQKQQLRRLTSSANSQQQSCPEDMPYIDYSNCISCSLPAYFDFSTKKCSNCDKDDIFDSSSRQCQKLYWQPSGSYWLVCLEAELFRKRPLFPMELPSYPAASLIFTSSKRIYVIVAQADLLSTQLQRVALPVVDFIGKIPAYNDVFATCAKDAPYFDCHVCIRCEFQQYFNFDNNKCESCGQKLAFNLINQKYQFSNPWFYTNLGDSNIFFNGNFNDVTQSISQTKSGNPSAKECPSGTPYYDSGNDKCISCSNDEPLFDIKRNICINCPTSSTFNIQSHICLAYSVSPRLERMFMNQIRSTYPYIQQSAIFTYHFTSLFSKCWLFLLFTESGIPFFDNLIDFLDDIIAFSIDSRATDYFVTDFLGNFLVIVFVSPLHHCLLHIFIFVVKIPEFFDHEVIVLQQCFDGVCYCCFFIILIELFFGRLHVIFKMVVNVVHSGQNISADFSAKFIGILVVVLSLPEVCNDEGMKEIADLLTHAIQFLDHFIHHVGVGQTYKQSFLVLVQFLKQFLLIIFCEFRQLLIVIFQVSDCSSHLVETIVIQSILFEEGQNLFFYSTQIADFLVFVFVLGRNEKGFKVKRSHRFQETDDQCAHFFDVEALSLRQYSLKLLLALAMFLQGQSTVQLLVELIVAQLLHLKQLRHFVGHAHTLLPLILHLVIGVELLIGELLVLGIIEYGLLGLIPYIVSHCILIGLLILRGLPVVPKTKQSQSSLKLSSAICITVVVAHPLLLVARITEYSLWLIAVVSKYIVAVIIVNYITSELHIFCGLFPWFEFWANSPP